MRMKRVMKCSERIIRDDDKFPWAITIRRRAIEKSPFKLEERRWKRKYDSMRSMEGLCQVTAPGFSLILHSFQRCPFFLTRHCWCFRHTDKNKNKQKTNSHKVSHRNVGRAKKKLLVFYKRRCPTVKQNKRWHLGEEMSPVSFCLQWRPVKLDAHSELVSSSKTDTLNNKARSLCVKVGLLEAKLNFPQQSVVSIKCQI